MAVDEVTIWNQALSLAGSKGTISDANEKGREADLSRLWYPLVRDNILKAASWPSAKSYKRLALLATRDFNVEWVNTDPAPTWKYAYALPPDLIAPRNLATYVRFERSWFSASNQTALMTMQEKALLHYSFRQDDVAKWDIGLENAVIHSLAAQLTMPLTGKRSLAESNRNEAVQIVLLAQQDTANESDDTFNELPSWIEARGYEEFPAHSNFVYPYEQLLGINQ